MTPEEIEILDKKMAEFTQFSNSLQDLPIVVHLMIASVAFHVAVMRWSEKRKKDMTEEALQNLRQQMSMAERVPPTEAMN